MKIFFVRHGESENDVLNVVSDAIDSPIALTEKGVDQAAAVGNELVDEEISAIYSSPFGIAKQTSAEINKSLGVDIIFDDRLRERISGYDGRPISEWNELMRDDYETVPEAGESYQQAKQRVKEFLSDIKVDTIVVVSHEEPIQAMLEIIDGTTDAEAHEITVGNCKIIERDI